MTRTAKVTMPETQYSNSWQAEFTAEQIEALIVRLQAARKSLAEPPVSILRIGDYGYSETLFWIVTFCGLQTDPKRICVRHDDGRIGWFDEYEKRYVKTRLGNLFDLLKDGPILVGLTEEEAALRFEAGPSRQEKIRVALDRYRAAQKKEPA